MAMAEHGQNALHHVLMEFVRVAGLLQPDQIVSGGSISISGVFALHELDYATEEALSQQALAERLRLEKSTVSRIVADLEAKGLLVRERDPENRRLYQLRITAKGRMAHARMAARFNERFDGLVAGVTPAEQAALLKGLPALIRVIRESHMGLVR
jgi:DNA-binding MarR family transcriptional regulator